MTDRPDTEALLRDLAPHLDVPPPPSGDALTTAVLTRLDEHTRRPRVLLARLAAAVIALLLALGAAMAVSPQVRAAVLDLLRVGAVQLTHQPPPEASRTVPLPGERTVTLDQARDLADFPLKTPAILGDPHQVRVAGGTPPRVVTLHHEGVRVDQIDGTLDPLFLKFSHTADAVPTRVGDAYALWLPRPHAVRYLDPDGHPHEEPARLAATTLIWQADGITYRVEGDLTRADAVRLAESLR
ncbi:hypothetical protein [Actinophytocola gossypii]|uniref:DUF4367 domain-containing protein n=1 Tax=Actinophytocola gossypii TaxID=2812003 RepID=A0ABT2J1K0_9PSEU|nr:hypothetical protein [Actinophytocola gossypii]MCT2581688.1 hypothetical protein [Actinophytocola gossypii]